MYKAGGLHADFEEFNLLQQLYGAKIAACNLGVGQFQPEVAASCCEESCRLQGI